MKYDIPSPVEISRDIYNLNTFDIEFEGNNGALKRTLMHLSTQSYFKAMQVCTDISKGSEERKSFDRGYVHGVNEVLEMFNRGLILGRKMQFPSDYNKLGPKTV